MSQSSVARSVPVERGPFSQRYMERLNSIKSQRMTREQLQQNDPLESRSLGNTFAVASSDSSQLYRSLRSFGNARPIGSRSQSRSVSRSSSRDRYTNQADRKQSRSRSRSSESRRSLSFQARLDVERDIVAAERQKEEVLSLKKEQFKKFLSSSKPWIPSGNHVKVENLRREDVVTAALEKVNKYAVDKSWRRTRWPSTVNLSHSTDDEYKLRRSSELSPTITKLGTSPQRSQLPRESLDTLRKSSSVMLHNSSSKYLALTVRLVNHRKRPSSKQHDSVSVDQWESTFTSLSSERKPGCKDVFGILVIQRNCSLQALLTSVERQFDVPGQVSDICIVREKPYSQEASVASLALNTLQDPPYIDEDCDITVFLNGALFQTAVSPAKPAVQRSFSYESAFDQRRQEPTHFTSNHLLGEEALENELKDINRVLHKTRRDGKFLEKMAQSVVAFDAFASTSATQRLVHPNSSFRPRDQLESSNISSSPSVAAHCVSPSHKRAHESVTRGLSGRHAFSSPLLSLTITGESSQGEAEQRYPGSRWRTNPIMHYEYSESPHHNNDAAVDLPEAIYKLSASPQQNPFGDSRTEKGVSDTTRPNNEDEVDTLRDQFIRAQSLTGRARANSRSESSENRHSRSPELKATSVRHPLSPAMDSAEVKHVRRIRLRQESKSSDKQVRQSDENFERTRRQDHTGAGVASAAVITSTYSDVQEEEMMSKDKSMRGDQPDTVREIFVDLKLLLAQVSGSSL